MRLLCISDREDSVLYGPTLNSYAAGVDAVISCGDLPFDYLEYIVTFLGVPLYYVLGNHDPDPESGERPGGCIPLDGRVTDIGGVFVAGFDGSRFYSGGPNQFTDAQMRLRTAGLSARVFLRSLLGRPKPTVFVSHAPPLGLGDAEDHAHIGFEAFPRAIERHEPVLWLHGHVHLYGARQTRSVEHRTRSGLTRVVNVFGHHFVEV
ncbi:putative phosphoesterases related to the Icc protein [Rubrobacter radiotolerans]|uniref:Metallophosphoesterase n=1 Tax=Rubrobacter radiotolerans TaxID=42256 RepID=A0A023X5G5_RUBRA|nr:metallophosphoesterase [Rubrobacter radiotolerans]AHY47451.1 putative phosphoesterases related to the Icc protein [Rubrobacter radiotolerans]MDX5894854.1 metallophosphoesterase [Rubrobacter radiotolerans]SMC06923.1 Predicted phosphoesterase [Rubrobacter radiotolerans DSM 5868]